MKRSALIFVMILAGALSWAEKKFYTVETIVGRASYEAANGKWIDLTEGMRIDATVIVNTGINSTLTLVSGDEVITVKPMKKGTLTTLVAANGFRTAVRIASKAGDTKTSVPTAQEDVLTATKRAKNLKEDVQWDE